MAPTEFHGIFSPRKARFTVPSHGSVLIKESFSLRTLLLIGAGVQGVVTLVLPSRYALLPAILLALHTIATTIHSATTFKPGTAPLPEGGAPALGRTSVRLPLSRYDPSQGQTPFTSPPPQGVVAFHLCVRFTHPLGILAPGASEVSAHFAACNDRVVADASAFGCLGQTSWHASEKAANNTMLTVYYFRDVEGLNRFAHDAVHRRAWDWYHSDFIKKLGYSHIGVYHETFCAPPGGWEIIGANMPPTLLGAMSVPVLNEQTGEKEWASPLVDAYHPAFKSQYMRMGRPDNGKT